MKTPFLFDMAPDGPTRRQQLLLCKRQHGIATHYAKHLDRHEHPWMACLLVVAWEKYEGYGVTPESSLTDCVAKVGRLLDEAGLMTTGETERDAVRELCRINKLPCKL